MATVTWENVLVLNEKMFELLLLVMIEEKMIWMYIYITHGHAYDLCCIWSAAHESQGLPTTLKNGLLILKGTIYGTRCILQPSSVWQEKMYDTIQTMVLKWWLTQQSELELIYFHTLNRVRPLLHNHQQEISSLSKQRDSNTFTCELVCPTVQYEQLHIYFTPTARDLIFCVKSFLQLRNPK